MQQTLKYEVARKSCKTIFKWLGVMVTEREQFWEASPTEAILNQLNHYEISFEEIRNQVVKEKKLT
jgi:hypothetical protein